MSWNPAMLQDDFKASMGERGFHRISQTSRHGWKVADVTNLLSKLGILGRIRVVI